MKKIYLLPQRLCVLHINKASLHFITSLLSYTVICCFNPASGQLLSPGKPGNDRYNFTLNGETGTALAITAPACSNPVISSVDITQPVCGAVSGTIIITATGAGLEYSINGGSTWGTGNSFGSLPAGNYNVQVRSQATCVSVFVSNPVVLNPAPGPFTIMADPGSNGTVTPAGTVAVTCGSDKTYTITPGPCFNIANVLVDGVPVGAISSYTFTNTTADHTISASFIGAAPVTPVIHGPVNVCPYVGTGASVNYTVDSVPYALSYNWVVSPTMTLLSGQGTRSITVSINAGFIASADKRIRVTANSPCDYNNQGIYYLLAQLPSAPQPITGSANTCGFIGTGNAVAYTIRAVTGASSYIWSSQAATTVLTHPNGSGPTDTTVLVIFNNGFTTSPITVQAVNQCGAGSVRSLLLKRIAAATPSLINGPVNACANTAPSGIPAVYVIAPVGGAASYIWMAPAGASVTHVNGPGINDTSIRVLFPAGFTGGDITVTASSSCGTGGTRVLHITRLVPSAPGAIDSLLSTACPGRTYTYSVPAMPANCSAIQWTAPGNIVSGQGTTSIVVAYPVNPVTGTVSATSSNNCAVSSTRTLPVNIKVCDIVVPPPPPPPFAKEPIQNMDISLYPNPSAESFNLRLNKSASHPVMVRVLDMEGVEIKKMQLNGYETIHFGSNLKPGRYMIEITDGVYRTVKPVLKF